MKLIGGANHLRESGADSQVAAGSLRTLVINAFSHTLQTVFIVSIPFAVVAFIIAFFMKEIPLRQQAHISVEDAIPSELPGF